MADKDVEKLVRRLRRAGWTVERTGKNYRLVFAPYGSFVVRIPSTPSSPRTIHRIRAILRRAGFEE
jgi:hypothetical protein